MLRRLSLIMAMLVLTAAVPNQRDPFPQPVSRANWLQFDRWHRPRSSINAGNVGDLKPLWRAALPEPMDGSPVYVSQVQTKTRRRDLLIVSTIGGRVEAFDATTGLLIWETAPPIGLRWTTSSPAVDRTHAFVYAYALDGYVHRYDIRNGEEVIGPGWPALITLKGDVEKGSSNISIATAANGHTYVYMTAAGYPDPGDAGDYQGHLVAIDAESGEQHVFNALCSDRDTHFTDRGDATDCTAVQAGIWARAGAVYDAQTDRLFVTTGNGTFDADHGGFNWGTSVVALRPDGTTDAGTPLDSYTPENFQELTDEDLDLSSTTIEILPSNHKGWPRLGVQSGKDAKLRLLNLENLSGQAGPRHLGGELQLLDLPQGDEVLSQPAAWVDQGNTWLFLANHHGVTAYQLAADADDHPHLVETWTTADVTGTTPVIVNGILYLASPHQLTALSATTGGVLWHDDTIGDIHWQSPIAVHNIVCIGDDAGTVTAYAVPATPR